MFIIRFLVDLIKRFYRCAKFGIICAAVGFYISGKIGLSIKLSILLAILVFIESILNILKLNNIARVYNEHDNANSINPQRAFPTFNKSQESAIKEIIKAAENLGFNQPAVETNEYGQLILTAFIKHNDTVVTTELGAIEVPNGDIKEHSDDWEAIVERSISNLKKKAELLKDKIKAEEEK